jgi:hypothetical protein
LLRHPITRTAQAKFKNAQMKSFSAAFSEKRSQPPLETFLIFFKEQI